MKKSEIEKIVRTTSKTRFKNMVSITHIFWICGGMAMFFVLKDEDRQLAKNGVKVGAILTIVLVVVIATLWGVLFASLLSNLTTTGATTTPIPDSGLFRP
jgi:hypothetical protein